MKDIESKLMHEKANLEAFHAKEENILAEISRLEREVAEKKRAVEELQKKMELSRSEKKELEGRLNELDRLLKVSGDLLARRMVALYKCARRGYVGYLASAQDLDQFRRRIRYARSVMEEDRRALGGLVDERKGYIRRSSRMEERISAIEVGEEREKAELDLLRRETKERVLLLINVHKEKEFYETAVRELKLAAQDLKGRLLKVRRRKSDGHEETGFGRFLQMKGKLVLPIEGRIFRSEQFQVSSELSPRKGIFIQSPSEKDVRAVYKGRVDFSGRLKGYGEVIVVNHGSRYYSISALLSERLKKEGDLVGTGEVIGKTGRNGVSRGPGVYFEIRQADESLDPLTWLKIR